MRGVSAKPGIWLTVWLLCCFGCLSAYAQTGNTSQEIRVRIYSLHSIGQLTLSSLPFEGASWKRCTGCRLRPLSSPIVVTAHGDQLQYGNS
jgi:hypothetical protein